MRTWVLFALVSVVSGADYAATLTGTDVVPEVDTSEVGVASCTYTALPSRLLSCVVSHNVADATGLRLYRGLPGKVGAMIQELAMVGPSATSRLTLEFFLTLEDEIDLYRGRLFLSIVGDSNPEGHIRGHLGQFSADFFSVVGAGVNVTGFSHTACRFVGLDAVCVVFHSQPGTGLVRIQLGVGATASHVLCSSACPSPVLGGFSTDGAAPLKSDFLARNAYSWVRVAFNGIRGQLGPETPKVVADAGPRFTHYANLDVTQELAVSLSEARGFGLFFYNGATKELSYHVQHNVEGAYGCHLHVAPIGRDAGPDDPKLWLGEDGLSGVVSPLIGRITLPDEVAEALRTRSLYVNLHSDDWPAGAIRGQVLENINDFTQTYVVEMAGGGLLVPAASNQNGGLVVSEGEDNPHDVKFLLMHTVPAATVITWTFPSGTTFTMNGTEGFGPVEGPLSGELPLSPVEYSDLALGLVNVAIASTDSPDGVIGGQLQRLSDPPTVNYAGVLEGSKLYISTSTSDVGVVLAHYDRNRKDLYITVAHEARNPISAAIYEGLPNKPGVLIAAIAANPSEAASPFSTVLKLSTAEEDALISGQLFVSVATEENPGGHIRAQLGVYDGNTFGALGNGDNAVPSDPSYDGQSVSLFQFNTNTSKLKYYVFHTVPFATAIHLHHGTVIDNGANKLFICGTPEECAPNNASHTFLTGELDMPGTGLPNITSLLTGESYTNIHVFGPGKVRGNIARESPYAPRVSGQPFTHHAFLDSAQEFGSSDAASSGLGLFHYDPQNLLLYYHIQHNVPDTTEVHIHVAPPGLNAAPDAIKIDLGLAESPEGIPTPKATLSPMIGIVDMTPYADLLEAPLRSGGMYVNVHSAVNPSGAIRGQVYERHQEGQPTYVAQFAGGQEAVPVATAFHAIGGVKVTGPLNVDYYVYHTASPNEVHLHFPTSSTKLFLSATSPDLGSLVLTESQMEDLQEGRAYFNIHTSQYPAGELWGQLKRLETLPPFVPTAQPEPFVAEEVKQGLSAVMIAVIVIGSFFGCICIVIIIVALAMLVSKRGSKAPKSVPMTPISTGATPATTAARTAPPVKSAYVPPKTPAVPPAPAAATTSPPEGGKTIAAKHDYESRKPGEVTVTKGQSLSLIEDYGDGWCKVSASGDVGIVPTSYLAL